ncbi:hypothetical protein LINPERHAP2_LOCUS12573, partial [Linum perenne]
MKRYYSAIRSSTSDLPIAQEVESQSSASEQCLSHPPSPTRISQPSPTLMNQHKQQCGPSSAHNSALRKYEDLMKQPQSIQVAFCRQSDEAKKDYRTRLEASLNCIKFLLHNG